MANQIQIANLPPSNFVDSASRYNGLNVLYYGPRNIITFETYKKKITKPSNNNKYYVITNGTEYRPDLVSLRAYGTVSFWWRIMEANNIMDIYDFKAGVNILIPDAMLFT